MNWRLAALLAWAGAGAQEGAARPALIPTGGIVLFRQSAGPLSFEAPTPRDLPPGARSLPGEARGRACQYAINVPLGNPLRPGSISGAGGDGGYRRALEDLRRARPDLAGVYDVKADLHVTSVLGVFRRLCVEVTGRGFQ